MENKFIEAKSGTTNKKYNIRFVLEDDDCDRYCIQGLQVFIRTYVKPCEATIIINGAEWDASDFVDFEFDEYYNEYSHGCEGTKCLPKQPTPEILERIEISEDVYNTIADIVMRYVSVAYCDYYDCQY